MAELRNKLIARLERIPDVEVRQWKSGSDFTVIEYRGKEVAHFHGNNELDIRLSKEVVQRDGLTHAPNHIGHPNRKNGGRWLMARFTREAHLGEMIRLVTMAIELR